MADDRDDVTDLLLLFVLATPADGGGCIKPNEGGESTESKLPVELAIEPVM